MRRTTKINRNFLHCTINSWYGLTVWQAANFSLLLATGCGVLGEAPSAARCRKAPEGRSFGQTGEVLAFRGRAGRFRPHLQMNVSRWACLALTSAVSLAVLAGPSAEAASRSSRSERRQ